jgi:hypothetical protein
MCTIYLHGQVAYILIKTKYILFYFILFYLS